MPVECTFILIYWINEALSPNDVLSVCNLHRGINLEWPNGHWLPNCMQSTISFYVKWSLILCKVQLYFVQRGVSFYIKCSFVLCKFETVLFNKKSCFVSCKVQSYLLCGSSFRPWYISDSSHALASLVLGVARSWENGWQYHEQRLPGQADKKVNLFNLNDVTWLKVNWQNRYFL